jgi:hypothetical protein
MEAITSGELTGLIILAVVLLGGLFALRLMFKLTATLFRLGCFVVLLIVVGAAIVAFMV